MSESLAYSPYDEMQLRALRAETDNDALRQRVTELEAAVTAYLDEGLGGDCFINGTPDRVFDRFRALVPGDQG